MNICNYHNECSGCSYWGQRIELQQQVKTSKFLSEAQTHWEGIDDSYVPEIKIHNLGEGFLRERLDFTWQDGRLGLFNKDRSEILDLKQCLQLSLPLQSFLSEIRQIQWPIEKGSLRLRVSPLGKYGLWLDFSKADIKFLFEEKKTLQKALQIATTVEIGQRNKKLTFEDNKFKLKNPEFLPWSITFQNEKPIELFSTIASFSQVGSQSVFAISKILQHILFKYPAKNVFEFGCGIGTLTLAIGTADRKIMACENDGMALLGLEKSLQNAAHHQVQLLKMDLQNKAQPIDKDIDLLLINPPRFGVGNFFQAQSTLPAKIIYMSCFLESLVKDTKHLVKKGYLLKEVHLVDQFPQTDHGEFITFWAKPD